jgi:hypothetical protein
MGTFIAATSLGFAVWAGVGVGLIALGVTAGVTGYILGAD